MEPEETEQHEVEQPANEPAEWAPAPNEITFRIWRTKRYGTAAEVNAKWNRGELGPEDDPWYEHYGPIPPYTYPPPRMKSRSESLMGKPEQPAEPED